jgi:hypothetical protein
MASWQVLLDANRFRIPLCINSRTRLPRDHPKVKLHQAPQHKSDDARECVTGVVTSRSCDLRSGQYEKLALASVVPKADDAELPFTAAPAGVAMIAPYALPAAMTQFTVLAEQLFRMMKFPAAATSTPRSAPMQLLPSTRLLRPKLGLNRQNSRQSGKQI